MGKKQRITVYSYSDCDSKDVNPHRPVKFSDAKNIVNQLITAIKTEDEDNFCKLLDSDFIYPGNGLRDGDIDKSDQFMGGFVDSGWAYGFSSGWGYHGIGTTFTSHYAPQTRYNHYKSTYKGDHHTRYLEYEYYDTRPCLEALFFEYTKLFQEFIATLAQSKNALMHQAFVRRFEKNQNLPQEILKPIDEENIKDLTAGIQSIRSYGELLKLRDISKGAHALELSNNLERDLKAFSIEEKNPNIGATKSLDFKFKFVNTLHSKDKEFIGHRGWKRVVTNVASILFSGAILNLINWCVTGNFLFFNKTETQTRVKNIEKIAAPTLIY